MSGVSPRHMQANEIWLLDNQKRKVSQRIQGHRRSLDMLAMFDSCSGSHRQATRPNRRVEKRGLRHASEIQKVSEQQDTIHRGPSEPLVTLPSVLNRGCSTSQDSRPCLRGWECFPCIMFSAKLAPQRVTLVPQDEFKGFHYT